MTGEGQLLVNSVFCEKMNWTDSPIGKRVNDYGTVVGLLDSFSFADMPNDNLPVMVEWTGKTAATLHVRLKEPLDENLARLNEEMHRIYPQKASYSVRWSRKCAVMPSLYGYFVMSPCWFH